MMLSSVDDAIPPKNLDEVHPCTISMLDCYRKPFKEIYCWLLYVIMKGTMGLFRFWSLNSVIECRLLHCTWPSQCMWWRVTLASGSMEHWAMRASQTAHWAFPTKPLYSSHCQSCFHSLTFLFWKGDLRWHFPLNALILQCGAQFHCWMDSLNEPECARLQWDSFSQEAITIRNSHTWLYTTPRTILPEAGQQRHWWNIHLPWQYDVLTIKHSEPQISFILYFIIDVLYKRQWVCAMFPSLSQPQAPLPSPAILGACLW